VCVNILTNGWAMGQQKGLQKSALITQRFFFRKMEKESGQPSVPIYSFYNAW